MSLIHDALKKVEEGKEGDGIGSGAKAFQSVDVIGRPPVPVFRIVLIVLLVGAMGFMAYTKLVPKKKAAVAPAKDIIIASETATQNQPAGKSVGEFKRNAIDAYRANDFETAWSMITMASGLDKMDSEIWNNMGLIAKKRGDIEKAKESYLKALEIKPDYAEALNNIAVVEMATQDFANSKKHLDAALVANPSYAEANFNMAFLYERMSMKEKSVEYYKRFLDVSGDFPSSVVDAVRDHLMEIEPQ